MRRVVIAGVTGNLGRFLCAEYQRRGWYVIALVRTSNQVEPIAADQLIEADATDAATLKGSMAGTDLVVSCLGALRQSDGQNDWDVNFQANLDLLREAERAGVGRFVYVHILDAHERSQMPINAARSAFVADLQRAAIATTVITHSESSGEPQILLGALGLDMAGAGNVTQDMINRVEYNFATTKAASIHQIYPERN
jgi:uncharacterized protein YbjT (DUF2867 family)